MKEIISEIFIYSLFFPWLIYLYLFVVHYFIHRTSLDNDSESESDLESESESEKKIKPLYEEKYLTEFREMDSGDISLTEEQLVQLKNSIVMECTPVGNVAMFYEHKRETFSYYSDSVIPYRFLEVVGRKYVIMNKCKHIFVDMAEELKKCEDKKLALASEKEKETLELLSTPLPQPLHEPKKKDVFAKFKSYNNNNTKSSVSAPQKNIPTDVKNNNDVLKDNANRYTCEGRFSNFQILKKVDKKIVDKRLAMTFADFKKMQNAV
jgi:hypothetical protein